MNSFQKMMHQRLIASTLCAANHSPGTNYRAIPTHAVVFADHKIAVICGPADDPESVEQARALAACETTRKLFNDTPIQAGYARSSEIAWAPVMASLGESKTGRFETGRQSGTIIALFPPLDGQELIRAAWMAACTETAQALDPKCPNLGSFETLQLAATACFELAS